MNTPYTKGYNAYLKGDRVVDNPYGIPNTYGKSARWVKGYHDAKRDKEQNKVRKFSKDNS